MSSPVRMLGSSVRIPLKAWIPLCVYSVFVFSCVGSGLALGWFPIQGVLPTVRNWSETKHSRMPYAPSRSRRDEWMTASSLDKMLWRNITQERRWFLRTIGGNLYINQVSTNFIEGFYSMQFPTILVISVCWNSTVSPRTMKFKTGRL
jgi:hypothetical protein